MNNERMLELADELEDPTRLKINFNMADFISLLSPYDEAGFYRDSVSDEVKFSCGTTCCIGGHACLLFGDKGTIIGEATARKLLDLTQDQANRLFYNTDKYIADTRFEDITREQAAAAVRRMVATEGE